MAPPHNPYPLFVIPAVHSGLCCLLHSGACPAVCSIPEDSRCGQDGTQGDGGRGTERGDWPTGNEINPYISV